MSQINYRIIGFGEYQPEGFDKPSFFNQFNFSSTLDKAKQIYNELYQDPEMNGAVLIEVNHEDWKVISEFGSENVEVVFTPFGTIKVVKSSTEIK